MELHKSCYAPERSEGSIRWHEASCSSHDVGVSQDFISRVDDQARAHHVNILCCLVDVRISLVDAHCWVFVRGMLMELKTTAIEICTTVHILQLRALDERELAWVMHVVIFICLLLCFYGLEFLSNGLLSFFHFLITENFLLIDVVLNRFLVACRELSDGGECSRWPREHLHSFH